MSKRDGGSAFPTPEFYDERLIGTGGGMTLRDYFAAHAMQGFLADSNVSVRDDGGAKRIAQSAYGIADAMLAERAK